LPVQSGLIGFCKLRKLDISPSPVWKSAINLSDAFLFGELPLSDRVSTVINRVDEGILNCLVDLLLAGDPDFTSKFGKHASGVGADDLCEREAMDCPYEDVVARLDAQLCKPILKLNGAFVIVSDACNPSRRLDVLDQGPRHGGR